MSGKAASLLAFLGGGLWLLDDPKPVVHVNANNHLVSTWPSEALSGSGLPPECAFWNQSVVFSSEMCSLFVVNRAAAAYQVAAARAMRCTVRAVHSNSTVLPLFPPRPTRACNHPPTHFCALTCAVRVLACSADFCVFL